MSIGRILFKDMGEFLAELIKIFAEPKRRVLVAIGTAFILAICLLALYERLTGSVRIHRLRNETTLLREVYDFTHYATNPPAELQNAIAALTRNSSSLVSENRVALEAVGGKLTISSDIAWKFAASAALWLIFSVIIYFESPKREARSNFKMGLAVAGLSGMIGAVTQPFLWPWFHIFAIPAFFNMGFIVLMLPALIPVLAKAKIQAQQNKCLNNLRQLDGATQQWALEHKKSSEAIPTKEDLLHYLKDPDVFVCPSGGSYTLRAVSESPTCSEKGHGLPP